MFKIKLKDLAYKVVVNSFLKDKKYIEEELNNFFDYIFKKIDIVGEQNNILRNLLNLDKNCYYFRDGEIPLTGEEIINGDYLIFEYIGHNEDMYIRECMTIEEIEDSIIGVGGITNPFLTFQLAIIMGEVKEYSISFTNKADEKEYKFIKGYHDELPVWPKKPPFEIMDVKITWID